MSELLQHAFPEIVGTSPFRFRRFVHREDISRRVRDLGERLRADYLGKNPVFIGVLNGSFIFMADLIRETAVPSEVDFLKLSSYGNTMASGSILLLKDLDAELEGRHAVLVEDIVDSGRSLEFLHAHLMSKRPASLEIVAMFRKARAVGMKPHVAYVGIEIPDAFVVGYGLDYAQQWRHLPDLYSLLEEH